MTFNDNFITYVHIYMSLQSTATSICYFAYLRSNELKYLRQVSNVVRRDVYFGKDHFVFPSKKGSITVSGILPLTY